MKLLILLLLILFTNESYSEVWESINIPNYEGRINSIYFINETTGFATGVGNIWKTTNKGTNWSSTKVSSPLISYTSLKMSNDSIGYVTGNSGYFMKSTDSGNNWVYIYIPNVDDLYNIYCFSENELLVFGRYGKIVRTTNGGNSWINLSIETVATFRDAIFKNDIGYIVSSNSNFKSLWKSTNKGSNWQEQDIGRDIIGRSICLTNSGFLYILGTEIRIPNFQGIIGRSTNLGISWSFQNFQNPSISFYGMDFADDRVGYCLEAGNPSKIYKTIDSGNSWNKKDSLSQNLSQIYCKNNYVYVYGDSGNIFRAEVNTSNVISMNSIISDYILKQNYPNPFNPETTIPFTVNKNNSDVKLQIYDINGKLISTLINKIYQSGSYETKFNGNYLPTGVYFYKLSINNISQTKRMILMK